MIQLNPSGRIADPLIVDDDVALNEIRTDVEFYIIRIELDLLDLPGLDPLNGAGQAFTAFCIASRATKGAGQIALITLGLRAVRYNLCWIQDVPYDGMVSTGEVAEFEFHVDFTHWPGVP